MYFENIMNNNAITEERIREIVRESLLEIINKNKPFFSHLLMEAVKDIDMASELERAEKQKALQDGSGS